MQGNGPSGYESFLAGPDLDKWVPQTNNNFALLQNQIFTDFFNIKSKALWGLVAEVSLFSSPALRPYLHSFSYIKSYSS